MSTWLKDCRVESGLTQRELSELLGVSRGLIARWESGAIEIDRHALDELAMVLDGFDDWVDA